MGERNSTKLPRALNVSLRRVTLTLEKRWWWLCTRLYYFWPMSRSAQGEGGDATCDSASLQPPAAVRQHRRFPEHVEGHAAITL